MHSGSDHVERIAANYERQEVRQIVITRGREKTCNYLGKHSPLDEAEWTLVRSHPEIGLSILGDGRSRRELLAVLYHHERLDGSGYPYGLGGDAIPIEARIVTAADTYDALTSDRPYRKARAPKEARLVMMEEAGRRLDSKVVSALLAALDSYTVRTASAARGISLAG